MKKIQRPRLGTGRITKHFEGKGLKAQLLKGAIGSLVLKGINIPLTMVVGILLARSLGPENYGIYSFVLAAVALLGLPTKAGLPTLIVRETAKNMTKKRLGYLRGLLILSNGFVIGFSILVAIVAASVVLWMWNSTESVKINSFLWALWLLPLVAFGNLRGATLRGLSKVVQGQLPEQLIRPMVLIPLLLLPIIQGNQISSVNAIQYNILATFLAFVAGAMLLIHAIPKNLNQTKPVYEIRVWLYSLLPLSLFSGLKIADTQITIVILGTLGSVEDVGLYRVAATGAGIVAFGLYAANMALAPQVARLYNAGEIARLQRVITSSTRVVVAISFPVAFAFILWGEELICFLFGASYTPATTALAILCVGQLVNTSVGSVALVLNMTGHDKQTVKGIVVAVLINAGLTIILVPYLGMVGAAIGYAVSLTVWNLILMWLTKKLTGIQTFAFYKPK